MKRSCSDTTALLLLLLVLACCSTVLLAAPTEEATTDKDLLKLTNCSQSSTDYEGVCTRAIDGNVNQDYWKHSCSHTNAELGWWQANTTRRAHIQKIRIYNRLDCCSDRLNDFIITVDGVECAFYSSKTAFSMQTFQCDRVGEDWLTIYVLLVPAGFGSVLVVVAF